MPNKHAPAMYDMARRQAASTNRALEIFTFRQQASYCSYNQPHGIRPDISYKSRYYQAKRKHVFLTAVWVKSAAKAA